MTRHQKNKRNRQGHLLFFFVAPQKNMAQKTSKESDLLNKLQDVLHKQNTSATGFLDPDLKPVKTLRYGKNMTSLFIFAIFVALGLALSGYNIWLSTNKDSKNKQDKMIAWFLFVLFVVLSVICIREYFILAK